MDVGRERLARAGAPDTSFTFLELILVQAFSISEESKAGRPSKAEGVV